MTYSTYLNYQPKNNGKTHFFVNTMLARTPDAFPGLETVPQCWDLEKLNAKAPAAKSAPETSCFEGFPGTTDAWL